MEVSITLTPGEIEGLRDKAGVGGGFQEHFAKLVGLIENNTLTLSGEMVERSIRYCREYGGGGWQDALAAVADRLEAAMEA